MSTRRVDLAGECSWATWALSARSGAEGGNPRCSRRHQSGTTLDGERRPQVFQGSSASAHVRGELRRALQRANPEGVPRAAVSDRIHPAFAAGAARVPSLSSSRRDSSAPPRLLQKRSEGRSPGGRLHDRPDPANVDRIEGEARRKPGRDLAIRNGCDTWTGRRDRPARHPRAFHRASSAAWKSPVPKCGTAVRD